MKNIKWLAAVSFFAVACSNNNSSASSDRAASAADSIKVADSHYCYESFNGKDSIFLQFDLVGVDVSGEMNYAIQGKDRNEGTVRGDVMGDTLLLEYLFQSEGSLSSRQVIFLQQDSLLLEGYGESQEVDGKLQFVNRSAVKFGGGIQLKLSNCLENQATIGAADSVSNGVSQAAAAPGNGQQQGSETLYMYRWELKEINGAAVPEAKRPYTYLLFSPGQQGSVSGNGGCNRLTGSFELKGKNEFIFGPIASTKMACDEMERETVFLQALAGVNQWKIVDNQLFLQKDGSNLAVFQGVTTKKL